MSRGPASILRALFAPVALGVARARSAPSRWALPALGIALATALLISAAGGGAVAGERAADDAVTRLTPAERAIRLTWSGGTSQQVDTRAVAALRRMTPAAQTRSLLYLTTSVQRPVAGRPRQSAQLAAIAPLSRWVRLTSGRLPRTCTPRRCEVLAAGGGHVAETVVRSDTRLITVGTATLRSTVPLGFVPAAPSAGALAEGRPQPLLIGADPAALDALDGFSTVFRTQGWSAPLSTAGRPSWRLHELERVLREQRARLTGTTDAYTVVTPDAALAQARSRARDARDRVLLVGAGAAALIAAFVLLAGAALRRDLRAEELRLERRGARRWQVAALATTEAAWPAVAGVAAGGAVGVAVTALRARAAGVPAGALVAHALLTPGTLLVLGAVLLGCTLLLLAAGREPAPGRGGGRTADVAALGAVGALALALSRGGDPAPGDALPALLPPLACLAGAIVIARLARPALRAAERAGRRGPLAMRLAALGLSRAPSGPALTIAVVAVGCGLSCFAFAYRATLAGGDRDQAAYAVPLDVTVTAGPSFVSPLRLATEQRWRALTDGGLVAPVQRASASVPRGAQTVALPLLGVPAEAFASLHGWRAGDASAPRAVLARRLRPTARQEPRGPLVRAGDRTLHVDAASTGDSVELTAVLLGTDGSALTLALGETGPSPRTLTAKLPGAAAGRHLVAVEAVPRQGLRATQGHQQAENAAAPTIVRGRLTLARLTLGGRPVEVRAWRPRGAFATLGHREGALDAVYAFSAPGRALLGPPQPGDDRVVPVVTDPATAASAGRRGLLPLNLGGQRIRARVVGTVARFATVEPSAGGFIVADRAALAAVIDADAPGLAQPTELWLGVSPGTEPSLLHALARPPLAGLVSSSRRQVQATLRADPLARELVRTLVGAGAVALLLAALGVFVAVALALRDDAADLLDLETLGVPPAVLRTDVRLRAVALAAGGLIGGLALGAGLAALTVDAVQVTASGVRAVPPLVTVLPLVAWALIAVVFAVIVAAGVALLSRRALGGPIPARGPGGSP